MKIELSALTFAAGLLTACTVRDIVATRDCTAGACEIDQTGYCQGHGPPAELANGAGTTTCANGGMLAARAFQAALCQCADYVSTVPLTTDGPVAINGSMQTQAALQVSGSLTVAGSQGISSTGLLTVQGSLRDSGPLGGAASTVSVSGDAQVGQSIQLASLSVGGTLTLPAAATIAVSGANSVGTLVRNSVNIAAPCGCAASELLNIADLVTAHASNNNNDNAAIGLSADRLVGLSSDAVLDLPCGRYFLSGISSTAAVTLRPSGRVALFIATEISLMKTFRIELPTGSELDLFLNGRFDLSGAPQLGDQSAPSRLRIYVAGTASINLSTAGYIAGNFYAPDANLVMSDTVDVFGSLFLRSFSTSLPATIRYDSQSSQITSSCL